MCNAVVMMCNSAVTLRDFTVLSMYSSAVTLCDSVVEMMSMSTVMMWNSTVIKHHSIMVGLPICTLRHPAS